MVLARHCKLLSLKRKERTKCISVPIFYVKIDIFIRYIHFKWVTESKINTGNNDFLNKNSKETEMCLGLKKISLSSRFQDGNVSKVYYCSYLIISKFIKRPPCYVYSESVQCSRRSRVVWSVPILHLHYYSINVRDIWWHTSFKKLMLCPLQDSGSCVLVVVAQ